MKYTQSPCSCDEHAKNAPVHSGRHVFNRVETVDRFWRWECNCGSRGDWQGQSPSVSYHGWLRHVDRMAVKDLAVKMKVPA